MLRGARESIEERDDIDKEIFLLKNDLIQMERRVQKVKTTGVLREFIEGVFVKIGDAFFEAVAVFDDFFVGKGLEYSMVANSHKDVSEYLRFIKENIFSRHESVGIRITYSEMKYIGFEDCTMNIELHVKLLQNVFIVEISGFSKTLLYDEEMRDQDIKQMQHTIKERGKETIQAFINQKKEKLKENL